MRRLPRALALLASAGLLAAAGPPDWTDYEIILWHNTGPAELAAVQPLGVTAAKILGQRGAVVDGAALRAQAAPIVAAGLGFYVENIATDFYAPYHRWQPGHDVSWLFAQAKARHAADPADPSVFWRTPSLSDPAWQARIAARLTAHVQALAALHPLYYSLGDETGIGDLAAAWDFDRAPVSLAAMRVWLRTQYPSLAALNAQWGSTFADWDAVVPDTTDAALARHDDNFSSWSDFRAWMDVAFAGALRAGTAAVHAADPAARAGIEGGQIPGWGGYDYTRLPAAVDVMEAYEAGCNIEIARAVNPDLVLLTTSFDTGPAETRRLWHGALLGVRGAVLWDPDGAVAGARGRAMAPVFTALHGGAVAQFAAARPAAGPVAILYSPAGGRIRWLLDRRAEATPWTARDAQAEWDDAAPRLPLERAAALLAHRGLAPRWLTPAWLEGGVPAGVRGLLLPQAWALSDRAVAAVRAFAAGGGLVLADVPPGAFDEHGRRRPAPPLADVARLLPGFTAADLAAAVAGVTPDVTLLHPDGSAVTDVEIRPAASGGLHLLGLLRDAGPEGGEDVVLTLPRPAFVRDLLTDASAQRTDRLALRLEAARPMILALSAVPPPAPLLSAPEAMAGGTALRITLAGPAVAAATALHAELLDAAGVSVWSGNLLLHDGAAAWTLPAGIAAAAARVTELPGGQAAVRALGRDQ